MSDKRACLPCELHSRTSAGIQVSLWWSPADARTWVAVRDVRTTAGWTCPSLRTSGHATCSTTHTAMRPPRRPHHRPRRVIARTTSMEESMNSAPGTVAIPGYLVGTWPGYLVGTWKADPVHSEIAFSVRHLMISETSGRLTSYEVRIVTSDDPLGSSVASTFDLASNDTGTEPRDIHLRSADYFEVEKYPTMSYHSTGIRRTDDGWFIDGDPTLHGVTRLVPPTVEVNGFGLDPFGGQRAGFSATAQINRRDVGIDITTRMFHIDPRRSHISTARETSNKATFSRLHDAMNTGDAELVSKAIDEAVEPNVLFHAPVPVDATGTQALKHVWTVLLRAFPDLHVAVEDVIAEGDKVVFRATVSGTHQGEYRGLPPTGKSVTYNEIFIGRFAGGRIAEIWGVVDVFSQMQQLGAIPA
jgi:polyisoprenoid-binding protein YceI/predicted ester cyclase